MRGLIKILFPFTMTGMVYISPFLSVLGVFSFVIGFLSRKVFKFEFYVFLFLTYVALSTLFYDPNSFTKFEYYRYDGNVWISLTPVFIGLVLGKYIGSDYLSKFSFVALFIYTTVFMYWLLTKGCSFGGDCSFPGLFQARNATGGFLSVIITILLVMWVHSRQKRYAFGFILGLIILSATFSRGSLLGVILAAAVFYLFIRRRMLIDIMLIVLLLIISFSVAVYFYNPLFDYSSYEIVIDSYVDSTLDTKSKNIAIRAYFLWPKVIEIFINNPIFGAGFGSFNDVFKMSGVKVYSSSHAHNTFLHVLAEQGVVGLLLLFFIIGSFRNLWLKYRQFDLIFFDSVYFAFLAVLLASFTEHRLFAPASMLIVSTMIGMFLANIRIIKKRKIYEDSNYS